MTDYHIHYCIDKCANDSMTFTNIEKKCRELGITEGTILKHYCHELPNGKETWATWYKIVPEQWEKYLEEFKNYTPEHMIIHSGVETELCNEKGDINIPLEEQEKIDMVQLSTHYMIDLDCLPLWLKIYPVLCFNPEFDNDEGKKQVEEWRQKTIEAGEENILAGYINGYINAIKRFPKVKSLAHMGDGLGVLRTYLVDLEKIPLSRTIEIMEPLMRLMAEKNVMWELAAPCGNIEILKRANELGVSFTATADGHFIEGGWGPMDNYKKSRAFIDRIGLRNGRISF